MTNINTPIRFTIGLASIVILLVTLLSSITNAAPAYPTPGQTPQEPTQVQTEGYRWSESEIVYTQKNPCVGTSYNCEQYATYSFSDPRSETIDGTKYIVFSNPNQGKIYIQPFDPNCQIRAGANNNEDFCYDGINRSDKRIAPDGSTIENVNISNAENASTELNKIFGLVGCPGGPSGEPKDNYAYTCVGGGSVQGGEFVEVTTPESATDDGNDCADAGAVLGWIICPIGSALAEITRFIDNQLYGLLYINTDEWAKSGVKEAWTNIRTVSSALIVLVVIVAVASQIFSFDFVSAYTIRKVLPKIFIAVILIQLSYFLATMAINISNTVGFSTQSLISAPFSSLADGYNEAQPVNGSGSVGASGDNWIGFADVLTVFAKNAESANAAGLAVALGGGIAGLFSVGTIVALGSGGAAAAGGVMLYLLALIIPAVIALLASFIVIVLRVVLLIGIVVVAPLAITAWILPNTSKWFEKWWGLFFSLLAFFPIVIAFLTFGKIGALIIGTSAGDSTTTNIVLLTGVIVAYFLPYFLLFKIIRLSSGSLAKIQGAIDTVGKKAQELGPVKSFREQGLKSGAEAKRAKNLNKANTAVDPNASFLAKTRAKGKIAAGRSGIGTLGAVGAYGSQVRRTERQEALKKANEGIFEDMRDMGITDYDDQLSYLQAIAEGRDYAYRTDSGGNFVKDASGNSILLGATKNPYGDSGMQAAATYVTGQQKAGRNRAIAEAMARNNKQAIWSDVLAEKAGDVKKVSADVVGKPFSALKTEEIVSQDAASLGNLYESDIHNAVSAGDFSKVGTMLNQIQEAKSSDLYARSTDPKSRAKFDEIEAQLQDLQMSGAGNFESDYSVLYQQTHQGRNAPAIAPANLKDEPTNIGTPQEQIDAKRRNQVRAIQRQEGGYNINLVGDSNYEPPPAPSP